MSDPIVLPPDYNAVDEENDLLTKMSKSDDAVYIEGLKLAVINQSLYIVQVENGTVMRRTSFAEAMAKDISILARFQAKQLIADNMSSDSSTVSSLASNPKRAANDDTTITLKATPTKSQKTASIAPVAATISSKLAFKAG